MTESIIQHIENEKQPYRIPVFTIKPSNIHFSDKVEKNASVVRLTTCDFVTNYYNISYNNNCLRWIRMPSYESNDVSGSDISSIPTIPYYDIAIGAEAMHLCKLYITPGAYESIDEIIREINNKLYNSFYDLFKMSSTSVIVYGGQQFKFQYRPSDMVEPTDALPRPEYIPTVFSNYGIEELRGAVVNNATLYNIDNDSFNYIYYYVPGTIRILKSNTLLTYSDVIIAFENNQATGVDIYNGTINLPFTYLGKDEVANYNNFQVSVSDTGAYSITSANIPSEFKNHGGKKEESSGEVDYDYELFSVINRNLLRGGTISNMSNVNCKIILNNNTESIIENESVTIESASLDNFEAYSGIHKFSDRIHYQPLSNTVLNKFIYPYGFGSNVINPNLKIEIYIPNVSVKQEGTNIDYTIISTNKATPPTITILNPSNTNKIALSGPLILETEDKKLPNFNSLSTYTTLPKLYIKNPSSEILNAKSLTIRMTGTFNHDNSLLGYGVRIRKFPYPVTSSNTISEGNEVNDVYGIDIYNVTKDSTGDWIQPDDNDEQEDCVYFDTVIPSRPGKSSPSVANCIGYFTRKEITTSTGTSTATKTFYDFAIFDRKYILTNGTISTGTIVTVPSNLSSHADLYEPNTSSPILTPILKANDNEELLYDTYYYKAYQMIKKATSSETPMFVERATSNDNTKLSLKWFMPIIPVTSPTIYTTTINFLDVMMDPNFDLKYNTLHLQPILSYSGLSGGVQELTTNNYKLSRYSKQNNNVDNYYYNFQIDRKDLWYKLGFSPCEIDYNCNTIMSYNSSHKADESTNPEQVYPVYLIKGIYYSECLYHGSIKTPSTLKIESYEDNINIANIRSIILPSGYDIIKLLDTVHDRSLFDTYFNKTSHYAQRLCDLSIPKTIEIKITQNRDIEEYLNSNEIVDSIANIGEYEVIRDNEPTVASIQQELKINSTIELSNDNSIYVYLTNGSDIYSLMDTVATLNVEYIN